MKKGFHITEIVFAAITVILYTLGFYMIIEGTLGFYYIPLSLAIFTSSLFTLLFSNGSLNRKFHKRISSLVIYVGLIVLSYALAYSYYKLNNYSPVFISTMLYQKDRSYLHFRENGTFKLHYTTGFTSHCEYGRYKYEEGKIILLSPLKLWSCELRDTLIIKNKYIHYEFKGLCRFGEKGKMPIFE